MESGKKSYVKPCELLNVLVDDNGLKFDVGDEKDLSSFNDILISRVIEAMNANQNPHNSNSSTPG
jgi:hypothetical protein